MARIAITGAAGNVGNVATSALEGHEVVPITHREHEGMDSVVLDVTDREAFVDALSDVDVLIHLAANPSPYAEWDDLRTVNVDGVYNAYHAAVENDLDRVVYASSNHALNADEVVHPTEPETMAPDAPAVHPDDLPRPDSLYGVTKVAGEAVGDYFAHRYGLEVVNLRIGWLMTRDELAENVSNPDNPYPEAASRFARAMWLSPRDCRDAVRAAATATLFENPLAVHAVSANDERCLSLTHTLRTIGYTPRDNSAEALDDADVDGNAQDDPPS